MRHIQLHIPRHCPRRRAIQGDAHNGEVAAQVTGRPEYAALDHPAKPAKPGDDEFLGLGCIVTSR
jgi:hypothetical protein